LEQAKESIVNAYGVYKGAGYVQYNEDFEQRITSIEKIIDSL
jgi:hypothetical protein